MLTLFAIPKSFAANAHTALIQRNAIESWVRLLEGRGEVLLCGDDPGVAETARELGVRHLTGVATSDLGTPLVSDTFEKVRAEARYDVLAYVNADILFLPGLPEAVERLPFPRYLAVGERWDLDVTAPVDFRDPRWSAELRNRAMRDGTRKNEYSIDYFVFPRRVEWAMPPLVVGRPHWDHWMLDRARQLRIPLVDLSPAVLAVHQNHGFEHVPQARGGIWHGPEGDRNRTLYTGPVRALGDATHEMNADGEVNLALSDRSLRLRVKLTAKRAGGRPSAFVARAAGFVLRHGMRKAPRARWWRRIVYFATR